MSPLPGSHRGKRDPVGFMTWLGARPVRQTGRARFGPLVVALAATGLLAAAPNDGDALRQVVAAERAFADDAAAHGVGPAFSQWAAPDGVILNPDPVNARQIYGQRPPKPGAAVLHWWPSVVGVARSGDLAFDLGPWVLGDGKASGWFVTVWRRQADGGWRWVLDHGFDGARDTSAPNGPVTSLVGGARSPSSAEADDAIDRAERRIARESARGLGYSAILSRDARIGGLEPALLTGATAVRIALAHRPPRVRFRPLGGGVSVAGDLAYRFGVAQWTAPNGSQSGRYVRVWRREGRTWRILVDVITPP